MKKITILLIVLLSISYNSFSQDNKNDELKYNACVSATKMNTMYLGIKNPIDVVVSNCSIDEISIKLDNDTIGKIEKTDRKNQYSVIPAKQGHFKIKVYVGDKLVGIFPFRVLSIPKPTARINRQTGGKIKKMKLVQQSAIIARLDNFAFDLSYKVVSFDMVYKNSNNEEVVLSTKGNRIIPKQKTAIKTLKVGDTVIFQNIYAIGPDNIKNKINDIVFVIE